MIINLAQLVSPSVALPAELVILVFMLVISLLPMNQAFEINENLILAYSKGFKNTTNSLYVLKWATGITTAKGTKSIYFYFK